MLSLQATPDYHGDLPSVRVLKEAAIEIAVLPSSERGAMENAIVKLSEPGAQLGYPHSSHVKGTTLRELRPRRGRVLPGECFIDVWGIRCSWSWLWVLKRYMIRADFGERLGWRRNGWIPWRNHHD